MPSRVTLRRRSRAVQEDVSQQEDSTADPDVSVQEENTSVAAEEVKEEPIASTSSSKGKFVLVMDNGQLALVPESRAHTFRSLPKRGQAVEDESGTSTPMLKAKKKSRSQLQSSERSSPRIVVRPVKRGRGRPPKNRSRSRMLEFELEEDEEVEDEEDEGDGEDGEEEEVDEEARETPTEEADLRGPTGDDNNVVPPAIEQNVFVRGRDYVLRNDELVLDTDEEGEKKIDEKGNLLGEREYKFKTFASPYRADTEVQYALSLEVARGAGYRDSLYFFRQNPLLIKLSCTDGEKVMLIEQGLLGAHLQSRNVTMLAVRNVYKTQGAKVVKDGRFIVDDYYEAEAREAGKAEIAAVVEEEVVAPAPRAIERKKDTERDRHGTKRRPDYYTYSTSDLQGNPTYTTFGDAGLSPFERAKGWNARRVNLQKADIDEKNWMFEMARSVRGMNHEIINSRSERLKAFPRPYEATEEANEEEEDVKLQEGEERSKKKTKIDKLPIGFFEPVTNVPHYSSLTQPSWATLTRVRERPLLNKSKDDESDGAPILGNAKVGSHGWGLASFDQLVRLPLPRAKEVVVPAGASVEES